jgi:hypothetical protein
MWVSLDYLGCAMGFTSRPIVVADPYSPNVGETAF